MRAIQTINISILILIFWGCSSHNQDYIKWEHIKDSQNFDSFFNFALEVNDTILFQNCVDSLDKYKPSEFCIVLRYFDYYNLQSDSLIHGDFALEDQCDICIDYKMRNILIISIDKHDSIKTHYLDTNNLDYRLALINLHDTIEISYNLPETNVITYNDKEYFQRRVATFIYTQMLSDTIQTKTSWKKLIEVTKEILRTIDKIKDKKAFSIFGNTYNQLLNDQKILIDKLVPTFINIF
ncbi:MAG: hypothetical protein R2750_11420 [Bacteroidales bacterium]